MSASAGILVVAATPRELAPVDGWHALQCGVGPVEAAARTAAAIAAHPPVALVHVGIAGARHDAGIAPGSLVIGTESIYCDLGVGPEWAPHRLVPSAALMNAVCQAFPGAHLAAIGTSGRVGGSTTPVEAMEGFAVLRAAEIAGVPAIEVRAISNVIEEPDRSQWMLEEAFGAIVAATPRLVEAMRQCVK